jgi:peptidoglycan/LPS O-acetylase OafA/YrhL
LYFVILAVDYGLAVLTSWLGSATAASVEQWAWLRAHLWSFVAFLSNWSLAFNHVGGHVDHSTPSLAILWSIAVEEQFYVLFPLLLVVALRSRRAGWTAAAVLAATGLLSRIGFIMLPVDQPSIGPAGGMYYATGAYADVFLSGCAGGWVAARSLGSQGASVRLLRSRVAGALLLGALGALMWVWRGQLWYPYAPHSVVLYGATGVVFSTIILWLVANRASLASRALRSSPLVALGILSYAIYLWHPVGAGLVRSIFYRVVAGDLSRAPLLTVTEFLLYLILAVIGAILGHLLIERPFLRMKERFVAPGAPELANGRRPGGQSVYSLLCVWRSFLPPKGV